VVFAASSAQRSVVAWVKHHLSLGQDCVVFDFCLADGGAVVGEDDESGITVSEGTESALVAKHVFAALDDETQLAVDVL